MSQQINQSKANSRGPLIAVIKIEIDTDNVDRIFLHQNDDEYRLAEQFQQKHKLNIAFVQHIYQRIKTMSKQSLKKQTIEKSAPNDHSNYMEYNNPTSHRQINQEGTPFNKINNFTPIHQRTQKTQRTQRQYKNFVLDSPEIQKQCLFQDQGKHYNNKSWQKALEYKNKQVYEKPLQQMKYNQQQTLKESMHQQNSIISKAHQSQYSFNEDKPSRVKILTKDKIQEIQSSTMRRSLSKSEMSRITKDVTKRLYNQEDIKKNYLNKIKMRAKLTKQQQNQLKQLTLKPKINKISKIISNGRYGDLPVQDYLIRKAKQTEHKKQTELAKRQKQLLDNCSFKPEVNQISRKLTKDRSARSVLHVQNSQICSGHSYSKSQFRPSLNKVSEEIIKDKGNFQQRLKGYLEKKNDKLHKLVQQKTKLQTRNKNGEVYFKPRVNSTNIKSSREPKGEQIYDYLYEMSKKKKEYLIQEAIPKINENSQVIVQQMQVKRLAYIFAQLDSDQDGFISAKKISIDKIQEDVLQVIMPVLFEMQEMEIQLNFGDFRKAIHNLHTSLNTLQKSILYNYSTYQVKA